MLGAAVLEFLGAVLVGARVSSTVKNNIISLDVFGGDAGVALLGFTSAIIGSCTWLTFATINQMPVSTTHTVIGALIGVGIATAGSGRGVNWAWNGGGVSQVFASWVIAPCIAGGFTAIVFLFTKFVVLRARNPVKVGLWTSPVYFFVVAGVLTTSIIVKGSPSLNLDELPPNVTAGAVIGTAAVVMLLAILFWVPWVHAQVVKHDYTIRWYHFFYGPLLWSRAAPSDAQERRKIKSAIRDYYEGHHDDQAQNTIKTDSSSSAEDLEKVTPSEEEAIQREARLAELEREEAESRNKSAISRTIHRMFGPARHTDENGLPLKPNYKQYDGSWLEPWNMWTNLRYNLVPWIGYSLTAGFRADIHKMQSAGSERQRAHLKNVHSYAEHFDNDTEHLFSFLQVLTACTASFAHGANDVSNAIGPLSAVYEIWSTSAFPQRQTPIPVWILAYGGVAISIGLMTYGYRLIAVLGNRLTLHSPSRGFSAEFGASLVVVLASYLGLPVSTTQSITGATIAVSLCNGTLRSTNWRGVIWIFFSWVLTLPLAALLSGLIMAVVLNAPRFGLIDPL